MADLLPALTVIQPWAELIAIGAKPVENRGWKPTRAVADAGRIAIHAGKRFGQDELDLWSNLKHDHGYPLSCDPVLGAVVAVASVLGYVVGSDTDSGFPIRERVAFLLSRAPELLEIERSGAFARTFFGPMGWVLADVVRLPEPVPCRGAQRVWKLPEDVNAEVERQVARAA